MTIEFTDKEFRRLLDMVYIGNWILNSCRDDDRFEDYDELEEKLFALCPAHGMRTLTQHWRGHSLPSRAFTEGGIHEAIADYEDAVFFDILAEELSLRDMDREGVDRNDRQELERRIDEYYAEFEKNGMENVIVSETGE